MANIQRFGTVFTAGDLTVGGTLRANANDLQFDDLTLSGTLTANIVGAADVTASNSVTTQQLDVTQDANIVGTLTTGVFNANGVVATDVTTTTFSSDSAAMNSLDVQNGIECDTLEALTSLTVPTLNVSTINYSGPLVVTALDAGSGTIQTTGIVRGGQVQATGTITGDSLDVDTVNANTVNASTVSGITTLSGLTSLSVSGPISATTYGTIVGTSVDAGSGAIQTTGTISGSTVTASGTITGANLTTAGALTASTAAVGGAAGLTVAATTITVGRFLNLGQTTRSHGTAGLATTGIVCNQTTSAVQGDSGAISNFQAWRLIPITLTAAAAATYTNAATLRITGAPIAGTNTTITNPYALLIDSGATKVAALESTSLNAGSGTVQTTGAIVGNSLTGASVLTTSLNSTTSTLGAASATSITLGTSPTALAYYEEYTWLTDLQDVPSLSTTTNISLKVTKVGRLVNITFPETALTGSLAGPVSYLQSNPSLPLPARFQPASPVTGVIFSYDNPPVSLGNYIFDGDLKLYKFAYEGSFVGGGGYTILGFTLSYSV